MNKILMKSGIFILAFILITIRVMMMESISLGEGIIVFMIGMLLVAILYNKYTDVLEDERNG